MKRKRILSLFLSLAMVLSLCACGENPTDSIQENGLVDTLQAAGYTVEAVSYGG